MKCKIKVRCQHSEMIKKSKSFANTAHKSVNHLRKYTNAPYIVHPAAVAKLVAGVTDDIEMISAAWLHDVVEDTPVTIEEVRREFGTRVADLVSDLTDISKLEDGNRKTRKAIDREHTRRASPDAKTIKLADLIDNFETISQYDPDFAKIFMEEKKLLLEVLKDGNKTLYALAEEIVKKYYGGE